MLGQTVSTFLQRTYKCSNLIVSRIVILRPMSVCSSYVNQIQFLFISSLKYDFLSSIVTNFFSSESLLIHQNNISLQQQKVKFASGQVVRIAAFIPILLANFP